ncbi:MAG: RNA polymerase sigma factor [Ginsengibacter sp.]
MDEHELVGLLKQKDRHAFKLIVEKWQDMVFNTSLGIVQNFEDAEDLSQEVFIKVFESITSFKEEAKFSTWLYRITVSKCLDHLRSKKSRKRFAFLKSLYGGDNEMIIDPPDFFHPGVKMENKENAARLFKALDQLPDTQKVAFVLNKIEGLRYDEVAEVLDLSSSAVDGLLQRAKKNLQNQLKNYYSAFKD